MVPPLLTKLNSFSPLKTRNVSATAQHFLCAARKSIHKVRLLTSTNRQLSKKRHFTTLFSSSLLLYLLLYRFSLNFTNYFKLAVNV